MLSATIRRRALLVAVAGSAMSGTAVFAQFTWAVPGSGGSWNLNTNWSPVGIPNAASATATLPSGAAYTVSIDATTTVNSVSIAAPATVALSAGNTLYFNNAAAGLANSGTFVVNSAAANVGTYFTLQGADVLLAGTGQMVLNANTVDANSAQVNWWGGGERLTNGSQHTIRGSGRIRTYFTNNGTVNGDVVGGSIWFTDQTKTNNATIKAVGGNVSVNCRIDQDPAATLRADAGGSVSIAGSVFNGSIGTIGSGVTQFVGSSSIGSNTFFGNVGIVNGVSVYVENADVVNNGTFTVNPAGLNTSTVLGIRSGPCTISGTGTLRLNAEASDTNSAQIAWWGGGEVLTNAAGHSIRGTGRIRTYVTNNSTIAADVTGKTLWLSDQTKTNNSIIEATGGGALYFTANTVQSPSGIIRCDGSSTTVIQGCNINGGTITAAPGGSTTFTASAAVSNNPSMNGSTLIPPGSAMYFEATGMVNSGTLTVNSTAANTSTLLYLRSGNGTFSGNGTVVLNANPADINTATIAYWGGSEVLTNSSTHTIRGVGRIRTYLTNEGTVSADVSGPGLWLSDQAKTNNNLMRARNGAALTITSSVSQSSGGRILAENGSTVILSGATVSGGQLQSVGTGVILAQGSSHLETLTSSADLRVPNNHTLFLNGGATLDNNGTLKIGDAGIAGSSVVYAFSGNISLVGNGSLVLAGSGGDPNAATLAYWGGSEVVTNSAAHTIRGAGRIRTYLTNEGTVSADVPASTLWFTDQAKTNNNVIRALNGGNLTISATLNQGAAGRLQVFDGSVIALAGATLNGGTLEGGGNGIYEVQGGSRLNTFTNNARVKMLPAHTTYSGGNTITNNGLITIGDAASGSSSVYYAQSGPLDFNGNGMLILDANPANLDLATINYWGGGEVLTNGANHTIGGTGRIRTFMQNNGNLTPGKPGTEIGNIWKTDQRLTFGATGRLNIQVASATSYDQISGSAPLTLGGTLQVRLLNGYTGGIGTTYEIVHGSSITGTFSVIDIPDHPTIGLKYGVQYTNTAVLLRVTCDVDFNSDGVIDLFDYLDFVDVFSSGVPDADFNADGVVDIFDYLDFLDQFSAGCV